MIDKLEVENFDFKIMFKVTNCDLEEQIKSFVVAKCDCKLLKGVGLEYEKKY